MLVTSQRCFQQGDWVRCGSLRFTLVLWHLWQIDDFLVGPDALDRTCAGCFFFGPCTGHCPLRHALGPATVRKKTNSLHGPGPGHMVCLTWTKALSNVYASNRELEVVDWIAEQAFLCPTRSAGLVQIFPEEFGGQILHAPTSLWALQKFQLLEGVNKAQRGAGFYASSLVPNNFAYSVQLHGSSQHHRDNHNIGFCFCSKYGTFSFKVFGPLWKVNCGQNLRKRWKTVGIMLMLVSFQQVKCSGYPRKSELCQVGIV